LELPICTGLKRHLDHYLHHYNYNPDPMDATARTMPADVVYGARQIEPR